MTATEPSTGQQAGDTIELALRPAGRSQAGPWTLRLTSELLILLDPEGRSTFMVHQEEAARYLRIRNNLIGGRRLSFVIAERHATHRFRCSREQLTRLLDWLPHKEPARAARDQRYSAIGVTLFGVLHLLLPETFFWGWGLALILAGLTGIAFPRRTTYAVNGLLLLLAGLWDLLPYSATGINPWTVPPESRMVPLAAGSALVLWGIHQIAMLGHAQQLRAARAVRDEAAAFRPEHSTVIHCIGWANILASVLCAAYASGLAVAISFRNQASPQTSDPLGIDLAVFAVLTPLALLSATRFLLRRHAAYAEAKVSGQLLVSVAVFALWGLATHWHTQPPQYDGALNPALGLFVNPSTWGSVVVCVLLFNRWFARARDREMETQRD